MLEVLKKLYGDAVTEESLERFKEELGKKFVPKSEFNQRGEELKLLRDKISKQETELIGFQEALHEKEAFKQALEESQAEQKALIADYEKREAKEKLHGALEQALHKVGARSVTAVKALLNMEDITLENGKLMGLDEQVRVLKDENSYLFEAGEDNIQLIRPAAKGKADIAREDFQKMGYMEKLKLKKEQPELYHVLTETNRR